MKVRKFEEGFTHYLALVGLVVIVAISGVFVMVLKHHSASTKANQQNSSQQSSAKDTLNANSQTQSGLSTTGLPQTANASSTSTAKSSSSTKSTSSSKTSGSTHASSASAPAPAQTLLSTLTSIIAGLQSGNQVDVTAYAVDVPGPITTAQARPIVFSFNGQTYFAYHQESAADFTATASQVADSMAIVNATVSGPALVQAHLDKLANLVDPDFSVVGYSTGGN